MHDYGYLQYSSSFIQYSSSFNYFLNLPDKKLFVHMNEMWEGIGDNSQEYLHDLGTIIYIAIMHTYDIQINRY